MNLTEQLLSRREIYHGRIIDVQVDTVSLPNGNTSTREVVRHPGGVGILALDDEDCAVLVEQYRYVFGRTLLEIPAGKREPGEDPLTTARRELREETGLKAEHMEKLSHIVTTPGFCTEKIGLYLATGLSQHEDHPDEDEFLRVTRIPLKEAVQRVMNGEFQDAKTALGLLMAWQKLHPSYK